MNRQFTFHSATTSNDSQEYKHYNWPFTFIRSAEIHEWFLQSGLDNTYSTV
jgi:hypothetical protein